jgi:cobyrinic acid a,c-diamide synthase
VTAARIVIAAPRSGEGKTTVALGLMAALRERGLRVQGFKVGPDYLDTGYQRFAAGVPGRNLDLFMMGENAVRAAIEAANADVAVIEGVMGLFDGHRDGITPTSTADVARLLAAPVVLVLDAARMAASAGAVALGFKSFDPRVVVCAVILNHWNQGRDKGSVQAAMERAGVEVLGYLPSGEGLELPSRHLGLVVADELGGQATTVVERLGTTLAQYVDLDRLLVLAAEAPPLPAAPAAAPDGGPAPGASPAAGAAAPPRIAVAWDDAFAFYYADNLALLQKHGAELIFFSPLTASDVPVCDGLYLGGGYPELHVDGLSANVTLRRNLAAALRAGLPTYAECGGLLYLCHSLVDLDGRSWPLIGAVPGRAAMHDKLQGMGYREATLFSDSLLGPRGATVRGHEFHYSSCVLESDVEAAYLVDGVPEGYAAGNLFASYIHLHFAGYPAVVEHWLDRCRAYAGARQSGGQPS